MAEPDFSRYPSPEYEAELHRIYREVKRDNNRYRAYKLAMLQIDSSCFWCRRECKDYGEQQIGVRYPNDEATVDHVKSRLKGRARGEYTPKVLACRKCNAQRAVMEEMEIRAGRLPRPS